MIRTLPYFLFFIPLILCAVSDPQPVFEWSSIDYEWPNKTFKESLNEFTYIPQNNLPFGLDRWRDRVFVTVPRWKYGVVSTLNYVEIGGGKSQPLKPYPSFEKNLVLKSSETDVIPFPEDNPPLVSVYRVFVDKCDRLWVMDNAVDGLFGAQNRVAKKALYIYDLKTDSLLRRYEFGENDFQEKSFAANVVVDVDEKNCENAFAYITDVSLFGLVVYDFKKNESWRIERIIYFYPNPTAGVFRGDGNTVVWIDGILGLGLGNRQEDGYRKLYFHPLTSNDEFSVSTKVIRDKNLVRDQNATFLYKMEGSRGRNTQSTTSAFDQQTGVIFYAEMNRNGVGCWNTKKPLTPETLGLAVQDKETLNTPADIKIDDERQVWVLSDRLIKFLYDEHDPEEVNYRIFKFNADDLISETVCA